MLYHLHQWTQRILSPHFFSLSLMTLFAPTLFGFNGTFDTKSLSLQVENLKYPNNTINATKLSVARSSYTKNTKKLPDILYDYDEYYDDDDTEDEGGYENENATGRSSSKRKRIFLMKRAGTTYAWGRWEKWSRCSKSCVQIRKRQCIKR